VLQNSFHNQHIPRRRGDAHRLRPDLDREQGFDLQTRAIMRAVVLSLIAQVFWRIGVRLGIPRSRRAWIRLRRCSTDTSPNAGLRCAEREKSPVSFLGRIPITYMDTEAGAQA
jgi:hypothetical protein